MMGFQLSHDQIQSVPLFRNLSDDMLDVVMKAATTQQFARNELIFQENEEGNALFIILQGKVKVCLMRSDGKEAILAILRQKEYFGEMALLDNQPRSASVVALEPTWLLILTRQNFVQLVTDNPQLIKTMILELAGRLRKANQKIAGLAFLDAIGRVCGVLTQTADESGEKTEEGIIVRNRPSHEQLGMMAATTRETVTHCMNTLERRGYIVSNGRDLLIYSLDDLKRDFMTPNL